MMTLTDSQFDVLREATLTLGSYVTETPEQAKAALELEDLGLVEVTQFLVTNTHRGAFQAPCVRATEKGRTTRCTSPRIALERQACNS